MDLIEDYLFWLHIFKRKLRHEDIKGLTLKVVIDHSGTGIPDFQLCSVVGDHTALDVFMWKVGFVLREGVVVTFICSSPPFPSAPLPSRPVPPIPSRPVPSPLLSHQASTLPWTDILDPIMKFLILKWWPVLAGKYLTPWMINFEILISGG